MSSPLRSRSRVGLPAFATHMTRTASWASDDWQVTSDKKDSGDSSLVTQHSSLLLVGLVRRPHGLKGELSVEPLTSFPERFVPGLSLLWTRGSEERQVRVHGVRRHGKNLLLTFEDVLDVDAARGL